MNNLDKPRILLAGIAKNEAAYLTEWCFHHLQLGITGIMVYVNNTTDNSTAVLDKIGQNHNVRYQVVDGIEDRVDGEMSALIHPNYMRRTPLQAASYADIYRSVNSSEYDYILYLDIDEFLMPTSLISEVFQARKDAYYFRWFSCTGDPTTFSEMPENLNGEYDEFTKTMVKTGLNSIQFISPHTVKVEQCEFTIEKETLVLHRVLRSVEEYKAMILRSTPSVTHRMKNGMKLNRKGWTQKHSESLQASKYHTLKDYHTELEKFVSDNKVKQEIDLARQSILGRAKEFNDYICELNFINSEVIKVLPGTGLKHLSLSNILKQFAITVFTRIFFPSLAIKHTPTSTYLKERFGLASKKTHRD